MALIILIVGAILIVVAVRNSQGSLFTALKTDLPEYGVWAAAIIAIGLIGVVPGLKPISRGLLVLIILVIILNNYQNIISSFEGAWKGSENYSSSSSSQTASASSAVSTVTSAIGTLDSANSFASGFGVQSV